jgi:signal transduction histidine kinase
MRRRLAITAAATTTMVVVAFLIPLGLAVQRMVSTQALNEAELEARSLAPAVATVRDRDVLAELVRSAGATSSGQLTVFMPDGQVLGDTIAADADVALARTGRSFTTVDDSDAEILVPVVIPGQGTAVIRVTVPDARLHRGVTTAWGILLATGSVLVLLAVFVADRIARDVVIPTRALAEAAQLVTRGELQTRVKPDGPAEVAEVGRAFNMLVARIVELLAAEREAAADLSHRLRTPLTALRLDVERLPMSSAAERVAADTDAIEQAVTGVIHELRKQTRDRAPGGTDLVAAAQERIAFWTALAREQGRRSTVELRPGRWTVGLAADDIETIIDVLVGNVFAHTPDTIPFRIAVEPEGENTVRLVVEDEGSGFPPSLVARGVSGSSSSGLGLDIARRTAEAAGGSLTISTRPTGGARAEVLFVALDESGR